MFFIKKGGYYFTLSESELQELIFKKAIFDMIVKFLE